MEHQPTRPILSMGELLIDFIPSSKDMLLRDPGSVLKTASGSAGIFACAAALLGNNGGFLGKVGKDALSQMVTDTLQAQGVDMSYVAVCSEGQIGLAFLEYTPTARNYQYYRQNSVGSTLLPEQLDESYIASAYAVHYPGMLLELTPQMQASCHALVALAKKHGVLVSFDPNIRREIASDEAAHTRMLQAVADADIIAPTLDEAKVITGKETIGEILRTLHAMGPTVIALTRDKDGAVLSKDGMVAFADGIDEEVIDPTGAGDTFAAALCVGLQENMPLETLAAFCNCAGTLVVMRQGTIGMALPTRAEVDAYLKRGVCHTSLHALHTLP